MSQVTAPLMLDSTGQAIKTAIDTLAGQSTHVRVDYAQSFTDAQKAQGRTNISSAAQGDIAPEYSASSTYSVGDHVYYQGQLYICNTAISAAEEWTAEHWTATEVGSEVRQLSEDKADKTTLNSHTGNTSNPHSVTKSQVGLGNCDNTSDANKPISTATQTALNAKENKLPRYKDITSYFTDGTLWNRISGTGYAHPYYDICVGDYLDMGATVTCPDSYSGTTGSRYVTVASLGGLRCNGDTNVIDFPHLVMIPGQGSGGVFHFGRHAMNDTNTTEGGYVGSKMHTDVLGAVVSSGSATGTINQQLYNIFGSHLKTTRELLTNSINASGYNRFGTNSGCSNDWEWTSCQACLMSEVEVYGSAIWSSSGYDTGTAKRQFELFAIDEKTINNRSSWYWLKDVVSASYFAIVGHYGYAGCYSAGYANLYVRPRFVIA